MRRREFITLVGSAVAAWPQWAKAQQEDNRITPFLIDLPGWAGPAPKGTDKEMNGGRVITAERSYVRGDAYFVPYIVSGLAALYSGRNVTRLTSRGGHTSTTAIDGFNVTTQSVSGHVVIGISLGADATFTLWFKGVSENEAMAIAQSFDWKGIQAALNQ